MKRLKSPVERKTENRTGPKPKWVTMPNGLEYVKNLGRLGLTNNEICEAFGVVEQTIYNWSQDYPEFAEALEEGRLQSTAKVIDAVYRRATGCSVPETKILTQNVKEYDEQGHLLREYTKPLVVETVKHFPPDTGAAIFILHNRTRHLANPWSNRQHVELTGKDGKELNLQPRLDTQHLTLEQLKAAQTLFPEIVINNDNTTKK